MLKYKIETKIEIIVKILRERESSLLCYYYCSNNLYVNKKI